MITRSTYHTPHNQAQALTRRRCTLGQAARDRRAAWARGLVRLVLAAAVLMNIGWHPTAHAEPACRIMIPELKQIYSLVNSLESSPRAPRRLSAIALELLQQLQRIPQETGSGANNVPVNTAVRSLESFRSSISSNLVTSGDPSVSNSDRARVVASVRNLLAYWGCAKSDTTEGPSRGSTATRSLISEGPGRGGAKTRSLAGPNTTRRDQSHTESQQWRAQETENQQSPPAQQWSKSTYIQIGISGIVLLCLVTLAAAEFFDSRTEKRSLIRISTTVQIDSETLKVVVMDISSGGARLSRLPGVQQGDQIFVNLSDQSVPAKIRWLGETSFGVQFETTLKRSTLRRIRGGGLF